MQVYLDNAATTPLEPEVFEAMTPWLLHHYGNPSSIHLHGREAKAKVEECRKEVAELLNTSPSEIFFTSGGTEADNTVIISSVESLGIEHIITSHLEHHAVLHSIEHIATKKGIEVSFVENNEKGEINIKHLEQLLKSDKKTLVSIMHGNNEIGNLNDIASIGDLCVAYNSLFHSDTVQTMGHYPIDLQALNVDFIVGSAHKFHGPKGVGILYINAKNSIEPILHGGAQERNMRGGTENISGIVGMTKALQLACENRTKVVEHIKKLKNRFKSGLEKNVDSIYFNGNGADDKKGMYKLLNVGFPESAFNEMLIFNLDIAGISASAGSACSSGTNIGSHVLKNIGADEKRGHVRFSFSKMNTEEEIDYTLKKLVELYKS